MLKRIKNKYLRYSICGILFLVVFCMAYFAINRVLSSGMAVKLKETETEKPDAPNTSFNGVLRIATFNIAHGRGTAESNWQRSEKDAHLERLKRIARLLEKEKVDIAVLNEVDFDSVWTSHVNQAEFIAREARFPFLVEQRNVDMTLPFISIRYGNAVLSRYPIEKAELVGLPGYSIWETILAGYKKGVLCTIRLADGKSIDLLAVHLEHRSEHTRIKSTESIMGVQKASALPLIVAGDLNAGIFPDVFNGFTGFDDFLFFLVPLDYYSVKNRIEYFIAVRPFENTPYFPERVCNGYPLMHGSSGFLLAEDTYTRGY
jgi:endonuclease/exonuclease/phosphatase family metal-dependent hydrolase